MSKKTRARLEGIELGVAAERDRIRGLVSGLTVLLTGHLFSVGDKAPGELIRMGAEAAVADMRSAILRIVAGDS